MNGVRFCGVGHSGQKYGFKANDYHHRKNWRRATQPHGNRVAAHKAWFFSKLILKVIRSCLALFWEEVLSVALKLKHTAIKSRTTHHKTGKPHFCKQKNCYCEWMGTGTFRLLGTGSRRTVGKLPAGFAANGQVHFLGSFQLIISLWTVYHSSTERSYGARNATQTDWHARLPACLVCRAT